MGDLRPWHFVVLAVVLFVLFGYKKLPDATRSLGRSLRILKTEVKTLHDDEPESVASPELWSGQDAALMTRPGLRAAFQS